MRIGLDAKRAMMNHSGLGNYSRNLLFSLSTALNSWIYVLFSPSSKSRYYNQFALEKSFELVVPGLRGIAAGIWRSVILGIEINKRKIDIFHGLSAELPIFISQYVKKIVTIHDLIFERFPEHYKLFDRVIYRLKTKFACRIADKIVSVSEQTKRDLINYYKVPVSKIEVIHQGIDIAFYNYQIERNVIEKFQLPAKYFICVSSFNERKNQMCLVKAYENLKLDSSWGLVFVGRGKTLQNIQHYTLEQNLQNVFFLDEVSNLEELIQLYSFSYASIHPSIFEGFGIPLLESMACKTPVICSNINVFNEVCNNAALYFTTNSSEDLSNKMKQLIEDQNQRNQLIGQGIERLKNFDNGVIANKYLELYRNMI